MTKTSSNVLVVPPFECAWLVDDELRFHESGRGCIAFEACADNDVTVVFKEKARSKHYRTDVSPNYAIVLGSHRNRRLKIAVDGHTVVDAAGMVVSHSQFERFWISVYDGRITVGKGDPGKDVFFEWVDCNPNRKVQYVGLSSWDKHVGYRNIRMLPHAGCAPFSATLSQSASGGGGIAQFLENSVFSDLELRVGPDRSIVPAHRLVLACCCANFPGRLLTADGFVSLPLVEHSVLRAFLQYLYTGQTKILYSQAAAVRDLCEEFGVGTLANQCEQLQSSVLESEHTLKIVHRTAVGSVDSDFPLLADTPINPLKLKDFYSDGQYSDVEIFLDGYDGIARAHKLVLSAWSAPFAKMFTNGMRESNVTRITIRDVHPDVFLAMLDFMYTMHLDLDKRDDIESLLLSLLLLADQFAIILLQQACTQQLLNRISEESVFPILQVAATLQTCESLQDACIEFFAKHFEHFLCHIFDFKELDLLSLKKIMQIPDLCVTTEEMMLNATILWASGVTEITGWREADDYLRVHRADDLFGERLNGLNELLPFVRFVLIPLSLLQELNCCMLSSHVPRLKEMALEALEYLAPEKESNSCQKHLSRSFGINNPERFTQFSKNSLRFSHRSSNLKELFYICDGDSNGVIYYAGTSYGAHPWMNPVLTKKINVIASSPSSRYTDAKSLVSRQYQGTSFAGPYFEGGHPSAWWKIDLGKDHQLMCNHYTVRQDGSVNYIRSWNLQGSTDDEHWMDLKVHSQEKTLSQSGQFASWPIHGAPALHPLRFFRVILTGPTTSNSHPWNICLCYIELYGFFH